MHKGICGYIEFKQKLFVFKYRGFFVLFCLQYVDNVFFLHVEKTNDFPNSSLAYP